MKRSRHLSMTIVGVMLCSQAWLGSATYAQVPPVVDTFELKAAFKEYCEENPKFFEMIKATVKDGATLTFTQDVNGDGNVTDIQATINGTTNTDVTAITLNGLAFRRVDQHLTPMGPAEFILSGVNPGNNDHFITLRGKAVFDKLGSLTKVTGTIVFQVSDTYTDKNGTPSALTECFGSGTFGTGKKIP